MTERLCDDAQGDGFIVVLRGPTEVSRAWFAQSDVNNETAVIA